ncbi:hypothetical protein TSMEX_005980 [Taenia solium]|eukprot:TsM_000445800 transcript=TsM_000445800 gene=TsM_000445800
MSYQMLNNYAWNLSTGVNMVREANERLISRVLSKLVQALQKEPHIATIT